MGYVLWPDAPRHNGTLFRGSQLRREGRSRVGAQIYLFARAGWPATRRTRERGPERWQGNGGSRHLVRPSGLLEDPDGCTGISPPKWAGAIRLPAAADRAPAAN